MIDNYLQFLNEKELLYEEVLYFVAESRWKRLLAAGKLTKKQLRRIQKYKGAPDPLYVKQLLKQGKISQANQYIKKRGIVKSAKQWLAGVERGTQNILKRYGGKEKHKASVLYALISRDIKPRKPLTKITQSYSQPMGTLALRTKHPSIHTVSPSRLKKKERGFATLAKRHEADEVRTAQKTLRRTKSRSAVGIIARHQGGGHMSDEVLRKERELVRAAKALYGRHGGGREMEKLRKMSGEFYKKLGSKKEISKADRKAIRDFEKQLAKVRAEIKQKIKDRLMFKKTREKLKKKAKNLLKK